MTEAGHIHFGAEFTGITEQRRMKREAGAIPLSYACIRRPLIKIGLRAPNSTQSQWLPLQVNQERG